MCHVIIFKIFVFWPFCTFFFDFSLISCKVIIQFAPKSNRLWAGIEATYIQNFNEIGWKLLEKNHFEKKFKHFYCGLDLDLWPRLFKFVLQGSDVNAHQQRQQKEALCKTESTGRKGNPWFALSLIITKTHFWWPWPLTYIHQNLMGSILDHLAPFLKISWKLVQ